MSTTYFAAFAMAFTISAAITPLVKRLAVRVGALDYPDTTRKSHAKTVPRIGGLAIMAGFIVPFLAFTNLDRPLACLLAGILLLLGVGVVDDTRGLSALSKLFWQVIAAGVILAGGLGIVFVSNPFGGVFHLDTWLIHAHLGSFRFNIIPLANAISILWIVGVINAVNLADGLDGLAGGISAIAALVLFVLAAGTIAASPLVALLSIILLGALLGFLPYNFYPSSIFMGDSGAYTIGLILAVLAIYSGSKIAVGALVLGFAVIDMLWSFVRRLLKGKSPFVPDRGHLHYRMVDSGIFSHRLAVLILYLLTVSVGATILLVGGLAAFAILILLLVGLVSLMRVLGPVQGRRL